MNGKTNISSRWNILHTNVLHALLTRYYEILQDALAWWRAPGRHQQRGNTKKSNKQAKRNDCSKICYLQMWMCHVFHQKILWLIQITLYACWMNHAFNDYYGVHYYIRTDRTHTHHHQHSAGQQQKKYSNLFEAVTYCLASWYDAHRMRFQCVDTFGNFMRK